MACKKPSKATLKKYGLITDEHWRRINRDNCELCGVSFKDRRCFIDHYHAPGWSKMTDREKRTHIRGLLCFVCNKYRVAKNDYETACDVLSYLGGHRNAPHFS